MAVRKVPPPPSLLPPFHTHTHAHRITDHASIPDDLTLSTPRPTPPQPLSPPLLFDRSPRRARRTTPPTCACKVYCTLRPRSPYARTPIHVIPRRRTQTPPVLGPKRVRSLLAFLRPLSHSPSFALSHSCPTRAPLVPHSCPTRALPLQVHSHPLPLLLLPHLVALPGRAHHGGHLPSVGHLAGPLRPRKGREREDRLRRERLGEKFSRDGFGRALLYWVYWDGGGESVDDRLNGHGREDRLAGDAGRLVG